MTSTSTPGRIGSIRRQVDRHEALPRSRPRPCIRIEKPFAHLTIVVREVEEKGEAA
jgi:ribosomal protein L22